jgi:RNA polymerase sigma-70 factor (ECF subfamily)
MKLATVHRLHEAAGRRHATETDAELMRRIGEGDLSPLGVLYDRHQQGVRQFVARATSSPSDAEDITHETFLTLAKIAARYDDRSSARSFLLGIAAQMVRRRRRGLGRLAQALTSFAETFTDFHARTPEDAAGTSEEMRLFDDALSRLTDEKRLVFLLVEREGLSGEEVARSLDIPVNTVWTRLHHARNDLRKALSAAAPAPRHGDSPADSAEDSGAPPRAPRPDAPPAGRR